MRRIVLTMAAVMALLVPPLARATEVVGVLENINEPLQIDSVEFYDPETPFPTLEVTPNWGGEAPMTDTFQFQPLAVWPSRAHVMFTVIGVPGECMIEPVVKNMWHTLPVVLGSQVMFTDSLAGIAERPGNVTPGLDASAALRISPNPLAGGLATVRYSLPKAGAARMSVYNMAGQTVMERTLAAGRSGSVSLDLRHLSNGVYLVKLSSGGFAGSQKLVVQR
jgi:hypothetical protein